MPIIAWIEDGKKRGVAFPILLFATALLVRAPGLGKWCLAVDEFYFYKAVSFIINEGIPKFPGGGYYIRGVGIQYLAALPVSIIENHEFAVRIVPLLFGALTIPLFYLFCRKFLGEFESILCSGILLLSSWHIELSRFARMYMPFQFFFFLFLYSVHSGFRGNAFRHRLAAWIVATLTVFVYEGSIIPALLLAALVLTGDAGKTNKNLVLFSVLFLALLSLNLMAHAVNYRSLGVSEAEYVTKPSPPSIPSPAPAPASSPPHEYPVFLSFFLPDLGLLALACRSWAERTVLVLFACAGAWLTARSIKKYEGPYPKAVLYLSLVPLPVLPLIHQFGILAILGILLAMNRRDIRLTVQKDLPYWGIYVFLVFIFWGWIAVQSGNMDRIRHFLVGYPPVKYTVVEPFLRAVPMWMVFLLGMAAFSIFRCVLLPRPEEDTFPVTILILSLIFVSVFNTLYRETRYSFFFFPLFIVIAMGEMRAIRQYLSGKTWPALEKRAGPLLFMIPLAVFLSTEDFHLHHVIDVSSPDLNFRTGAYSRYAYHWYPRFDFKTPACFVEGKYMDGDVVVLEHVAMSQDLRIPFINYVGEDNNRFGGIARKGGTEEIWSGSPLISHPGQLASKVPENSDNSLWIIGLEWDFHERAPNLETRYEELAKEFGLDIELVFVGIDGRTGVWRMRREFLHNAGDQVKLQHGAKEHANS